MGQIINKKDPNIGIHIQVSKLVYLPGQLVQGNIYLDVKKQSQYDVLYIRLQGHQYCLWHQGVGKDRRRYQNQLKTYQYQFPIRNFGANLSPGQYTFPFNFVLPNQLTGSFYFSINNFIHYYLQAYLTCLNKKNDNQSSKIHLNIRQPLRVVYGPISKTQVTHGKCCGCCADYGNTEISLQCDRNFVKTDQQISVKTTIDNTKGSKQLQNVKLVLYMTKMMISNRGRVTTRDSQVFTLTTLNKIIKPGQIESHTLQPKIPNNLTRQTAIGSITAIWYDLAIVTQEGCCNYTPPSSRVHLILHSNNPALVIPKKIDPPNQWNPNVQSLTIYRNMEPFYYKPHEKLAKLNLRITGFIPPNENQGFQPNFNDQIHNPHPVNTYNNYNNQPYLIQKQDNTYNNNQRNFYNDSNKNQYERYKKNYDYGNQ